MRGAHAQDLNIDFGQPQDGPPNTYAAAGQPGYWNAIRAEHGIGQTAVVYTLRDINGALTDVTLFQFGGPELQSASDPGITGDDADLMNDFRITFTTNLETCVFIDDIDNGEYEVLLYALKPGAPQVESYTDCDQEFGNPFTIVSGAWPGGHQEGVTYSRHIATVTTGDLDVHSGIVPGNPAGLGAVLNGMQIRKILPPVDGDTNSDQVVDVFDVLNILENWGACPAPCPDPCAQDLTEDCSVDVFDLLEVLGNWT